MERDFFGLSSKNGAVTNKEDAPDKANHPAAVRGSGIQWSFSNKVSAVPQLLSFKATQEDRTKNTNLDPMASSGYMTVATVDAYESNQKPLSGAIQRNLSMGKQLGNKHGMTVYSLQQFDAHSGSHQEAKMFSVSNQSNHKSPVIQASVAAAGHSMVSSIIKPYHPHGGVPLIVPASVIPSKASFVGTTDLRNSSKASVKPAQLTIFYAGSVCVYEDISLEKAQAIMFLAGNGCNPVQKKTVSTAQMQTPSTRPSKDEGFIISQSHPSPLSSPLPMTFHSNSQPGVGSSSNNELAMMRPIGSSSAPSSHLESPNVAGSAKPAATKIVPSVGLPQARKASLARFLEKRKERVTSTAPYYMSKKSPESGTVASDAISFSINPTGSCPLPAIN